MFKEAKNKISILSLVGVTLCLSVFSINIYGKYKEMLGVFEIEKTSMKEDIDLMLGSYDELFIDNKNINQELKEKRMMIIALKDSISKIDSHNFKSLASYRKKISYLSKQNKVLFAKVDSLSSANTSIQEKAIVKVNELNSTIQSRKIQTKRISRKYDNLKIKTEGLESKLMLARRLVVSNFKAEPLKKRMFSEKYVKSNSFKKVSAFKISIDVLKNEFSIGGKKKFHVQVINESNHVIRSINTVVVTDGSLIKYTDSFSMDYTKNDLSVSSLIVLKKGMFEKGNYLIKIYLEGRLVGNRIITLS